MSSDLVEGNKKIFERIWKLVSKAERWCRSREAKNQALSDFKQVEKLNQDIYKLRNIQLSMVWYIEFIELFLVHKLLI